MQNASAWLVPNLYDFVAFPQISLLSLAHTDDLTTDRQGSTSITVLELCMPSVQANQAEAKAVS